jgi:signal transduction histidine kinase
MGKTEIIITIFIFNLFFILFIVGIIIFIRQYKLKKKEHDNMLINQSTLHQKEILATQFEMQQQTMQHIGREIHDNIGQKLTLASLYTQQLAYENKAPHINESIENISKIINQSLSDLRTLSKSLTDNEILEKSIYELISQEKNKILNLKTCEISLTANDKNLVLDYQQKTILLRIVQEFIQNSIKHSNCKSIEIVLNSTPENINLELKDDGKGFNINQKSNGIGLLNMKKRTEMLNGIFKLNSDNSGTQLSIILPIEL